MRQITMLQHSAFPLCTGQKRSHIQLCSRDPAVDNLEKAGLLTQVRGIQGDVILQLKCSKTLHNVNVSNHLVTRLFSAQSAFRTFTLTLSIHVAYNVSSEDINIQCSKDAWTYALLQQFTAALLLCCMVVIRLHTGKNMNCSITCV